MIRRPLFSASSSFAAGVTAVLVGALLSGCSDTGSSTRTSVTDAAAGAKNTATETVEKAAAPVADAAPGGDFASAWGPAVGTSIPLLAANDQTGTAQDLASLAGDKGLLLVFSRSADW